MTESVNMVAMNKYFVMYTLCVDQHFFTHNFIVYMLLGVKSLISIVIFAFRMLRYQNQETFNIVHSYIQCES